MTIQSPSVEKTTELILPGVNSVHVIDGLDGSGKGSCADALANALGGNVMIVRYPEYRLPWGMFLDHLLHESDEGLSLEDRMLVYALNRLETVPYILNVIEEYKKKGGINLIFDRFPTSNIITAAYYLLKTSEELPNTAEALTEWFKPKYKHMFEIDAAFLAALSLSQSQVYVPTIDATDSLKSVEADETRTSKDLYETDTVQELSNRLYAVAAELDPNIVPFSQYEGGKRMTPNQQAQHILSLSGRNPTKKPLNLVEFSPTTESVDQTSLLGLLDRYGSPTLKAVNPYKAFR